MAGVPAYNQAHQKTLNLFFGHKPGPGPSDTCRSLLFQRSIETPATDRNQLAHALDTQVALQKRYFLDLLVDPISPVSSLRRRRASTFCKAPLKKSTSSVFSASSRLSRRFSFR